MALPSAAVAAYQNAARMGFTAPVPDVVSADLPATSFSDFLSGAIKDSITTIKQGEEATTSKAMDKTNVVDMVQSMSAAELTLDTVVAVRDKVVAAYQSIMNMPI
jgi:flagellar hook-basal body complex protein FliE